MSRLDGIVPDWEIVTIFDDGEMWGCVVPGVSRAHALVKLFSRKHMQDRDLRHARIEIAVWDRDNSLWAQLSPKPSRRRMQRATASR